MEELSGAEPKLKPSGETVPRARVRAWLDAGSKNLRHGYALLSRTMHRTVVSVLAHDCLNIAQSTAYSAIVSLFPALVVAAAVIGLLPDQAPLRFQISAFFNRILPPDVSPMLDAYFQKSAKNTHTVRALVSAAVVSFLGASNVMATLMEGLRRARSLPEDCWSFWGRRRRAFQLVPLSLAPLAVASLLVVFGHAVTEWLAPSIGPDVRGSIYTLALLVRWSVALGASVGVIALIYHLGVPPNHLGVPPNHLGVPPNHLGVPLEHLGGPKRNGTLVPGRSGAAKLDGVGQALLTPQAWIPTLPGAVVATAMWFLTTLAFGWYVTRFANYSAVYGSLGAGIALLIWLYLISLSVLCGAEFNAHFAVYMAEREQKADPSLRTG